MSLIKCNVSELSSKAPLYIIFNNIKLSCTIILYILFFIIFEIIQYASDIYKIFLYLAFSNSSLLYHLQRYWQCKKTH